MHEMLKTRNVGPKKYNIACEDTLDPGIHFHTEEIGTDSDGTTLLPVDILI